MMTEKERRAALEDESNFFPTRRSKTEALAMMKEAEKREKAFVEERMNAKKEEEA